MRLVAGTYNRDVGHVGLRQSRNRVFFDSSVQYVTTGVIKGSLLGIVNCVTGMVHTLHRMVIKVLRRLAIMSACIRGKKSMVEHVLIWKEFEWNVQIKGLYMVLYVVT